MALQTKSIPIMSQASSSNSFETTNEAWEIFSEQVDEVASKLDLAFNEYSVEIAASTAVEDGGRSHVAIYANFIYEIK